MRRRTLWLGGWMIVPAIGIDIIMTHRSLAVIGLLGAMQSAGLIMAWAALRSGR